MYKRKIRRFLLLSILLLLMTACKDQMAPDNGETTIAVHDAAEEQETQNKKVTGSNYKPAEQEILTIPTSDGELLNAIYYPAKDENAPLVVLMHWAPGDQNEMMAMARWLQNRGLGGASEIAASSPWLDPSWFPLLPEDISYAVLTFTFRNCEGGCQSLERDGWLLDARAVAEFAYALDGSDPNQIIMAGASIGADGAVNACLHLNTIHPGSCQGAFSISPGNYLTTDYREVVQELGSLTSPVPAWCLFAESDVESAAVCENLEMVNYTAYRFPANEVRGNGHGLNLVVPELSPNPLDLLVQFIQERSE